MELKINQQVCGLPCRVAPLRRIVPHTHGEASKSRRGPDTCVRAPFHISSSFFKIRIGTADGLPQNFGHSSRGTWSRSVPPLVGPSRQEVPVMRALFDRVAISLKTVQMRIGSRQEVFRHATDTCPCSRGLVPSVWTQLACSNLDDSREFIRHLGEKSHVVVA